MKVLVTGGAGFIGSHLCETLSNLGMEVTSLDNLSTGTLENVNQLSSIKFLTGDITNKVLVDELVQISDLVFHLAAAVGVRTILTKPIESIQTNFLGSEIVLSACSKYDRRLVVLRNVKYLRDVTVFAVNEGMTCCIGNTANFKSGLSLASTIRASK